MRKYAIRVANYNTKRGEVISIAINDDEIVHFQEYSHWKVWGKGDRLYFLPSTPSNGVKISNNVMMICDSNLVGGLKKYVGEYDILKFDDVTHYDYIDLEDRRDTEINEGAQSGISKNKSKSESQNPIVTPIAVIEPKIEPSIVIHTTDKDKIKNVLNTMIVEYVMDDALDSAKAIATAMKRIEVEVFES